MVIKEVRCRWCGMPSLVPPEVKTLFCRNCGGSTMIQSGYLPYGDMGNTNSMSSNTYAGSTMIQSGYLPYGDMGDTNSMSSNTYAGFADYGKSYQPVDTGRVYQIYAQPQCPPAHGRKRAVLIGINYEDLHGCINDVMSMRKLLVEIFQFPVSSILVLTEEQDKSRVPTKQNIQAALRWLVQGCQSGDSLVFHYSGHGTQVQDLDGDESDELDECIVPSDHQDTGVILDDEINETIVRPLPRGATLHATFDSCRSGTVLDLPYVFNFAEGRWVNDTGPSGTYKGSMGGRAICFSACHDNQKAKDASSPTTPTGAMTTAFINAITTAFNNNVKITYQFILDYMHRALMPAYTPGCLTGGICIMYDHKDLQNPLLSASEGFRTDKEFKL